LSENQQQTDAETHAEGTAEEPSDERYQVFHTKGRWQGQPLRVEETGEAPRFEPLPVELGAPDVLIFGVPNDGMMQGQPTNVFLLGDVNGDGPLTLIDAGMPDSVDKLFDAFTHSSIDPARITRIVLTHCHPDHVGGAAAVQAASGAEVWAHPLERGHIERWGEGLRVDHWFDGSAPIACEGYALEPIFTPGHSPGHLCYAVSSNHALLAGDMISGFGSVGIFPPEGSMADYIASLRRMLAVNDANPFSIIGPGHGPPVLEAREKIAEYIVHRLAREDEVVLALGHGPATLKDLLPVIYPDVLPHLSWAAMCTLQAHVDKLVADGRVTPLAGEQFALA
jgi:glyoxylase-like metal-dependent hydrolase (beta-lactamase superfamily II)